MIRSNETGNQQWVKFEIKISARDRSVIFTQPVAILDYKFLSVRYLEGCKHLVRLLHPGFPSSSLS
jgi:hypothetical protein